MPHPRFLAPAVVTAIVWSVPGTLSSQTPDGYTVQERPGIVLIKPQPWAKDSEATVLEFSAYTDRTASGAAGAGYYEFRTKSADKRQVATSKVVKLIVFADPQLIKEVLVPADREKILATINDLKTVSTKFPATRTYVEPSVKKLTEEVAKYDAGQVKADGVWITKESYLREKSRNLANLLKSEIIQAKPAHSYDLDNDPKYIALKELAAGSPAVKAMVAEISETHAKLVRTEKRKALLERLSAPAMTLPEAESAVTELKALRPEEDPTSAAFVKSWDAATVTVKTTSATAEKLAEAIEGELAPVQTEDTVPELSADLDREVTALNQAMAVFLATKPAPQLVRETVQAQAVCTAGTEFRKLKTLFASRQFLEAKDVLDTIARQDQNIGAQTERVVSGLQKFTAGKIEEFSRLREEGKLLAGSNKTPEALAKYEAAYAVIPDADVNAEIARLKNSAAPAPQ